MSERIRLEGVLLSCDAEVVSVMDQVFDNFEIEAEVCQEPLAALKAISQRKLDTVIVDWDRRDEPDRVLSALRTSEKNAKSTAVAIISGAPEMQAASRAGVNVMIYKPMNIDQATRCLRAAYGNILLQRRRSARFPVDIPVTGTLVGVGVVEGNIIDISAGGLAFACRQPVQNDQQLSMAFKLPETAILIHVTGRVVHMVEKDGWRCVGMEFTSVPQREFMSLEQWLLTESQKLKERFISPDSERLN